MSDSKALVSTDNEGFFRRAGSAWHIIKGNTSANPLYPHLLNLQSDIAVIEREVRKTLKGNNGSAVELVKDLVENYEHLQITRSAEKTKFEAEIESLKNDIANEQAKLKAVNEERDILKQQLIEHSSMIRKIREVLETAP